MVEPTKLFPDDTFYPENFSLDERRYLRNHIGDKPSVMQTDPPPAGVSIETLQVAMTRLFDDPDVEKVKEEIQYKIDRSLRINERKQAAKAVDPQGLAPMAQLGVGVGRGQSRVEKTGGVRLSPLTSVREGFFDDLLSEDEKQGIVVDSQTLKDSFRLECGCCPDGDRYYNTGTSAYMGVGSHVRKVHPDHVKAWNACKTQVKRLQNEGDQRIWTFTPDGLVSRARPRA